MAGKSIDDPAWEQDRHAVGTRFERVARSFGGVRQAAEAGGMSPQHFRRYARGDLPQFVYFLRRLSAAAKVSVDWLLANEADDGLGAEVGEETPPYASAYVYLPWYTESETDEAAKATKFLPFRRDVLQARGWSANSLAAMTAAGDAMAPTIGDGCTLLMDTAQCTIRDGAIYVLRMGEQLFAKRLQRQVDGSVVVISDNPAYPDQSLPAEEWQRLSLIGRVIWAEHLV